MDIFFKSLKYLFFAVMLIFVVLPAGVSSASKAVSPLTEVQNTVEKILSIMRDETLAVDEKKAQRRQMILSEVEARFDFEEMSMRTLARNWRVLNREEKKNFEQLFTKLLEDSYTTKIESYSGEKVLYKKEVINANKALVYTAIVKNKQEIPINYKLKNEQDKWLVYDVVIEGVSLVRNYRTQFEQIFNKEKYSGLIKRMEEKIQKNEETQ